MAEAKTEQAKTRLGEMLRFYRFHRDLTVRDLAPEIGVSAATITRMESGQEVDTDTFIKLLLWMRSPVEKATVEKPAVQ